MRVKINLLFAKLMECTKAPGYWPMSISILILGISYSFTNPFISLYGVTEIKMSPLQLGVFMTILSASGILISTYLGKLSDSKFNRKWIILFSITGAVLGYLLMAVIRDYFLLLVISGLFLGIATASFPQLFAFAKEKVDSLDTKQDTTLIINSLRMFFSIAWVIGPAIGSILLIKMGFTGLFIFAAISFLIVGLIVVFNKEENKTRNKSLEHHTDLGKFLTSPVIFSIVISFTFISTASSMSMITLPLLIVERLNGTMTDVGLLVGVAAAAEIPFMIIFGLLASKVDKSKLIVLGSALSGIYYLIISLSSEVWHIIPAQLLSAVVVSIIMGIGISYFQDLLPKEPGTATTLYSNTSRLGSVLGGIFAGTLATFWGYHFVFYFCAALSGISFILLFLFGKTKKIEQLQVTLQKANG